MAVVRSLSFGSGINIADTLRLLDTHFDSGCYVLHLCGSAVPILAGCQFRGTQDVDFAILPPEPVKIVIESDEELTRRFDFNAQGIVGLLIDYEDRLVCVNLGLKHLDIYRLSLPDWVVSKLASPKLDDVLNLKEITLETLLWIKSKMIDYGGVSYNRAYNDLEFLIKEMS